MKFRKLLLVLAGSPLLLASCGQNILDFEQTRKWVGEHYKATESMPAITTLSWDYHSAKGDQGKALVKEIFESLDEQLETGSIIHFPGEEKGSIGEETIIEEGAIKKIPPLTINDFNEHFGKQDKKGKYKETFKIANNALVMNYTSDLVISSMPVGPTISDVTVGRVFNTKGYITGYGIKAEHKIDDDNLAKVKIIVTMTYSH